MEREAFTHVNEVILRGPIVRQFANDIACNFTIKTPRLNMPNTAKEGDVCYNYPEVAFYGELGRAASMFKEGDVVEIKAMIQPQKKISKEDGREFYDQKVIGQEIKFAETLLQREFGCAGGEFVESMNLVKFGGIISKIVSPSKGVAIINIRTFTNGRVNNVQTFIYSRNAAKYTEMFKVGDEVFAVGTIQTLKKKKEDGHDRYFKNVILTGICKVE